MARKKKLPPYRGRRAAMAPKVNPSTGGTQAPGPKGMISPGMQTNAPAKRRKRYVARAR